jgi:tetratricopeptide (TPR) repeat protein
MEERHAVAVPVMRRIVLQSLPLLLGLLLTPVRAHADDLLDDATRADGALEMRVHSALTLALDGDPHAAVRDMQALDRERDARGQRPTGLTDDMQLLAAGLEPTRESRRLALEDLLDQHPDPVVEHLARHALDDDDAAAASRLLSDDRHNRRANLINDAVRPLGVFSGAVFLAALNPFLLAGSAVDSVATTAVNLWNYNRLSPREREALVRYRTVIQHDVRSYDASEVVQGMQTLSAKRAAALCDQTVARAKSALDAGDLDVARYYVRTAQQLPDCTPRVAKTKENLAEALAKRAAADEAELWPADDVILPAGSLEAEDYEALARATALGEPDAMMAAAQRFERTHPGSMMSSSAKLVVAASRDLAGRRPEARTALEELSADDSRVGKVAEGILEGPDFGQLTAMEAAERHHTRNVAKYVLFGGIDGRSALYTAAQLGAQGAQAGPSLGIVNVIGIATRAWHVWRRDPVSNQEVIDRGEELLARNPDGAEAKEVHARLSTTYERAGNYERALMHYRASADPDPKRIAKLQGKLADRLLDDAKGSPAAPLLFSAIARDFKGTGAADKAEKLLKDAPPRDGIVLDLDVLRANPALLGPTALDLDPMLLDGDPYNGELADKGVTLANRELRLTLRADGTPGERVETRTLTDEQYARARAAAEETLYTKLLTTVDKDPEEGRFERYIPIYISGSLGDNGLTVAPGIKTRPYQSPDRALYEDRRPDEE